jgi:chromosomal replication initiator protein
VREALTEALPPSTFELWLESLRPLSLRDGILELEAPAASRAWVERRYGGLIERVARERVGDVQRVRIGDPAATPVEDPTASAGVVEPNPLHTFDRFVIGPSNRLAHSAALAVAELPGEAYNPLFLHGPPGLGKTHLLGAIAGYLGDQRPDLSVHCTTAERFTTEFVTCLREDGPAEFKRRHRDVDALLIDDVQALEGKRHTEEEFVDTFNALHRAGKQIVLSSDRPPEALEQLAERLRDRFHWGLTVELTPPDIRTRLTLLWRMTTSLPMALDEPSALSAIAATVPENVRRLEGAMTRVAALGSMLSEPLTHGLVTRALGGEAHRTHPEDRPPPRISEIQAAVAQASSLTAEQLTSSTRAPRVARARQVAMYLSRDHTTASLATIARAFNRDHTTVGHAIRAVEGRLEPGSDTLLTVQRARSILGISESPLHAASPPRPPDTQGHPTPASRIAAGKPGEDPPSSPSSIHLT